MSLMDGLYPIRLVVMIRKPAAKGPLKSLNGNSSGTHDVG